MIARTVRLIALIAAAAAICWLLAEWFGVWTAAPIWAGVAAAACGIGTVLLRTSPLGRVTWRNRAAAYLIPWGWRLNGGRLWPVPLISWAVWAAAGAAVFVVHSADGRPGLAYRAALFAAWATDAAAVFHLAGTIRQGTPGGRVRPLWTLAAVIAAILATSVGLYLGDRADAALILAGGPPAVAGGVTVLVLVFFLTVGRNTRWN